MRRFDGSILEQNVRRFSADSGEKPEDRLENRNFGWQRTGFVRRWERGH
jgi:hypothetical protein